MADPGRTAQRRAEAGGGALCGVAPGEPAVDHLDHVGSLAMVIGATYLVAASLVPKALAAPASMLLPYEISGGSMLIVVCTILDIQRQLRDMSLTRPWGGR